MIVGLFPMQRFLWCWLSLIVAHLPRFSQGQLHNANESRLLETEISIQAGEIGTSLLYEEGSLADFKISLTIGGSFLTGAGGADREVARQRVFIHGALMLCGWGVLIPTGTMIAAWAGPGFEVGGRRLLIAHRRLQTLGLVVGVIGFVYAMRAVLNGGRLPLHGRIGVVVTCLGVFQPLLVAFTRLFGPTGKLAERLKLLHRITGRMATMQGMLQCVLGSFMALLLYPGDRTFTSMLQVSISSFVIFILGFIVGKVRLIRRKNAVQSSGTDIEQNSITDTQQYAARSRSSITSTDLEEPDCRPKHAFTSKFSKDLSRISVTI